MPERCGLVRVVKNNILYDFGEAAYGPLVDVV